MLSRIAYGSVGIGSLYFLTKAFPSDPSDTSGLDKENQILLNRIMDRLPSLENAQKMQLYRAKSVLSREEIERVKQFAHDHESSMGQVRRDAKGTKRLDGSWKTTYLHTGRLFQENFPEIYDKLLRVAYEADRQQNWDLLGNDEIRPRVIELHEGNQGAGLLDVKHHDHGSLVTVDVMCCDRKDFKGGDVCTLETDGELKVHHFELGDAVVFPSHKYHCVNDIEEGKRFVLVMELWHGKERTCAHRCLHHLGECHFSPVQNRLELLATAAMPEVDPW